MSVTLDLTRLFFIISGSVCLSSIAVFLAKGKAQRFLLLAFLAGLAWYSGIGAADPAVSLEYVLFYFIFFLASCLGFHFSKIVFYPMSSQIGRKVPDFLGDMSKGNGSLTLIFVYILLTFFPLVWPEMRILKLIYPGVPNLNIAFGDYLNPQIDVTSKLLGYIKILLTPFFYLSLYRLRKNLLLISTVVFLLLYLVYIDHDYIGRGTVLSEVGGLIIAIWFLKPNYRRFIFLFVASLFPIIVYLSYWYGNFRIGGNIEGINFWDAVSSLLAQELSFPKRVSMRLLELGTRTNLAKYFTWIVTLPLPKFLTGGFDIPQFGFNISEIVLGLPTGSVGWYVVLPGLVGESFYLYGPHFFWLHGFFCGFLACFFVRLVERVPQFLFLYAHLLILFFYYLNRGGIFSLLPRVINYFLLFYVFIFFIIFPLRFKPAPTILSDEAQNSLSQTPT